MTTRNDDEQYLINIIESLEVDKINKAEYDNGEKLLHMLMVYEGYDKSLDLLLSKHGIEINAKNNSGETALHYAAKYGNFSKARKLIEKGININAKDNSGKTVLHYATIYFLSSKIKRKNNKNTKPDSYYNDIIKILELVLNKDDIDINAKDNSGKTVLHYAVEYDSISLTNKLIAKGIDIDAKDNSGDTALHYAAKHNKIPIAVELVEKRIDINAKNNSGNTALHYAVEHNNMSIARELVLKGINIYAENNSGQTALDLDRYQELYNLLGPRVLGLSSDSLIDDVDKSGPPPPTGLPGKGPAQWYKCNPDIKYEDGHPCYNKGGRRKRKSRKRKTTTRRKRKTTTTRRNNRKKRTTRRKRNNRKKRT